MYTKAGRYPRGSAVADEASVRISLQIRAGLLNFQSQPTSFQADVATGKGPCPGAFTATTSGTNVDLSQLTQPGLCRIMNLDPTNRVEVGIHDGALFHPLMEILPGEFYLIRLSRNVGEEEDVPGTGTSGDVNALCVRAVTASCVVVVEAFES